MVQHPNKVFLFAGIYEREDREYYCNIIIAAESEEIAKTYVKQNFYIGNIQPIWLMNCGHTAIYDRTGTKLLTPQVKVLANYKVRGKYLNIK